MLDKRTRRRTSAITADHGQPPEALVISIVPALWTGLMRGRSANVCVDARRILHYAYAQFGICSELRATDLTVATADGHTVFHGTPEPSWDGNMLDGTASCTCPAASVSSTRLSSSTPRSPARGSARSAAGPQAWWAAPQPSALSSPRPGACPQARTWLSSGRTGLCCTPSPAMPPPR
ncbi:MAG TPA: hypothetical protein VGS19_11025 [Streptosporangiaceae bacterium]|nr:hypothetical protein [Streptosporangiaceae bacterium]